MLVWMAAIDVCTRECCLLEVRRDFDGRQVTQALRRATTQADSCPTVVQTDNAAVWREDSIRQWSHERGVQLKVTSKGSPWQNGVVEAYFGRLRNELLNHSEFADLAEAQAEAKLFRKLYNTVRPHGALGYKTPASYGASLRGEND